MSGGIERKNKWILSFFWEFCRKNQTIFFQREQLQTAQRNVIPLFKYLLILKSFLTMSFKARPESEIFSIKFKMTPKIYTNNKSSFSFIRLKLLFFLPLPLFVFQRRWNCLDIKPQATELCWSCKQNIKSTWLYKQTNKLASCVSRGVFLGMRQIWRA